MLVATPVRPVEKPVQLVEQEMPPSFASSTPMTCDNELTSVPEIEDDEKLVDYSPSLERMYLDINVLHLSVDGYALSEGNFARLDFGPKEAIFWKPKIIMRRLV